MWTDLDHQFMRRALEIASNGSLGAAPNPMVGAVIVRGDRIVAEGFHARCGQPHAEVQALSYAQAHGVDLDGATMYVSLEPCSHHGRTPPCCDAIISSPLACVEVATLDPNPEVAGGGVRRLRDAGKLVHVGLCQDAAQELNRRFFTYHQQGRPYVMLKWAQSADGLIDSTRTDAEPAPWLTNEQCRMLVHRWRAENMAILIGTNTAVRDNPMLTVRHWAGRDPLRVILDRRLRVPLGHLVMTPPPQSLILADDTPENHAREELLLSHGLGVELLSFSEGVPNAILQSLHRRGITSLIVEGGSVLLKSFIASGLWDEANVFVGPTCLAEGIIAPPIPRGKRNTTRLGDTILYSIRNSIPIARAEALT